MPLSIKGICVSLLLLSLSLLVVLFIPAAVFSSLLVPGAVSGPGVSDASQPPVVALLVGSSSGTALTALVAPSWSLALEGGA